MSFFRDSAQQVQACIDILEKAKTFKEDRLSKMHAQSALPLVHKLRRGKRLEPQIRQLVNVGNLNQAIKLLQVYQKHRGFNIKPLVAIAMLLGLMTYFFIYPRWGGHDEEALEVAKQCAPVVEALGDDINFKFWSYSSGRSTKDGGANYALWTKTLAGSKASGRYRYIAYDYGGPWQVIHAGLTVDDKHYLVVPCRGQTSEGDAYGRLVTGYDGKGKVTSIKGHAPVKVGDPCSVTITIVPNYPNPIYFNCRLKVRCANQVYYGTSDNNAYIFCDVQDGKTITAYDKGGTETTGDPMIDFDLNRHRLILSDDVDGRTYSFTISEL